MDPRLKTSAWRKARAAVLADEPLCVPCLQSGRAQPATDVDHITPRQLEPESFFDRLNLWGLCRRCHQAKTILERDGRERTREQWVTAINKRLKRRTP